MSQLKEGKLRAIGIASKQRHPLFQDVPTLREQGPPAGIPSQVAARLSNDLAVVLKDKKLQQRLIAEGAEPLSTTSQEFATFMVNEVNRWRDVVAKAGIQAD